jgi:hypothetical protein
MKLLIQELQTINVQMRIITEDNISQIESMAYSKNIGKLTLDPTATPGQIIEQIRKRATKANAPKPSPTSETPEYSDESLDFYKSSSPTGIEPQSPQYPDISPAYEPSNTPPMNTSSPGYVPGTPEYPTPPFPPPNQPQIGETKQPEYSPPEPPTLMDNITKTINNLNPFAKGGGGGNPIVGGTVYYRGSTDMGLSPNHIWNVKRLGDPFITIETLDPVLHDNTVLVVHPSELMDTTNIPPESEFFRDYMPIQNSVPNYPTSPYMSSPMMDRNSAPAPIQFNPMIKIVNGDDNSKNIDTPNASTAGLIESEGSSLNTEPIKVKHATKPNGGAPAEKTSGSSGNEGGGLFGGSGFFSNITKIL